MTGADWLTLTILIGCSLLFTGRLLRRLLHVSCGLAVGGLLLAGIALAIRQPWCPPELVAWCGESTIISLLAERLDCLLRELVAWSSANPTVGEESP
jgi:hypothetical protein